MTTVPHVLANGALSQDWSLAGLITGNDDWSGVASIVGYLGDIDAGSPTAINPQTLTGAALGALDAIANQSSTAITNGGVAEFDGIPNRTVALQGSGTADAPSLVVYLDATGRSDIRFQANLRDIDASGDDAAQQVAVQYRVGGTGLWQNVFYDADVTTGGTATEVTAVDVTLGADANNAALVEIRILTTNAAGSDEWVGVDDILVSSAGDGDTTPPTLVDTTPDDAAGNVAATADIVLQFSETITAGTGSFTLSNGAGDTRTISISDGQVTIAGNTLTIDPIADLVAGTTYSLTAGAGIVEDAAGNDYAGLDVGGLDFTVAVPLVTREIGEIQGLGHTSSFTGQTVRVEGVVTAVDTTGGRGFYIQSTDAGDGDSRTSEGLFIFTNAAPTVVVGQLVGVTGTVAEFQPTGGSNAANNLTITQIVTPTIDILGTAAITPIILGQGGLLVPTEIIDNDSFGTYDPAQDAIDFFESIEGQYVTVKDVLVAGYTGAFSEVWALTNQGANATGLGARGGITVSAGDFNPERIQLDNDSGLTGGVNPFGATLSQGDLLGDVNAVVSYDFQNYEFRVTELVTIDTDVTLATETTALVDTADTLSVASYNVLNLDPTDPQAKFDKLAADIRTNLGSPDIIALQEVQDADGPGAGADLSGAATAAKLIAAIAAAGGPTYTYVEIAPDTALSSGGEPTGNIRNGFLYNEAAGVALTGVERVDPTNAAFDNSRKPLAGEFTYNGETYTLVNVHFSSRSGSQALFGNVQPPANAAEQARIDQATVVRNYVDGLVAADANARVMVLGDFNGFQFEPFQQLLTAGGALTNLHDLLPEAERYSFQFDGNNQALDQILVTANLLPGAQFDAVHINAERFGLPSNGGSGSDHDPLLAHFNAAVVPVVINGTAGKDTLTGRAGAETLNGLAGNDRLFGNGGNDTINGGDGNDVIEGGAGVNTINGGAGADTIGGEGTAGVHIVDGGLGLDVFVINSAGGTVSVDLVSGAVVGGYADGSTLTGIEQLRTTGQLATRVELFGDDAINRLAGGTGDDLIDGRGGNDMIIGGRGADTLTGGAGNDRFVFRPGEADGDIILDFDGRGTLFGDVLSFQGFGDGAEVTNVGNVFTVSYGPGLTDVFTINGAVDASDIRFIG